MNNQLPQSYTHSKPQSTCLKILTPLSALLPLSTSPYALLFAVFPVASGSEHNVCSDDKDGQFYLISKNQLATFHLGPLPCFGALLE